MSDDLRTAPPFFLVGFQRSGTTLLRLMLNAHPELAMPHDSAELWLGYRARLAAYGDLRDPANTRALMTNLLAEPRVHAWQTGLPADQLFASPLPASFGAVMDRFHSVYARAHGKTRWGDKNTGHLTELDQLNAMFPDCLFIHLVRDGRDCALSHEGYVYGYENVLRVAREWREQVRLCRKMGAMLPCGRFHELRYEDLLGDPRRELDRICKFLGVPFAETMLEYHRNVEQHVPAARRFLWPLLDRPPVKENAGKWKTGMRRADRAVFERHAGDLLREMGYETSADSVRTAPLLELCYEVHSRIAWRLPRRKTAAPRAASAARDETVPAPRVSRPAPLGSEGGPR